MEATGRKTLENPADWQTFVPADHDDAVRWLTLRPQFTHLLYFALSHLGEQCTRLDAEEIVQDFMVFNLSGVIRNYNPSRGTFWNYLLTSLSHECWRYAEKLRERVSVEQSVAEGDLAEFGERVSAKDLLEQAELREKIELAGRELDERAWKAIRLHHLEDQAVDEIAAHLGESIPNTKVLLHRGRQNLRRLVEWQFCSKLRFDDVPDWPKFCRKMHDEAERQLKSIPAHLWSRLACDAQETARSLRSGQVTAPKDVGGLLANINQLLTLPDLWPKEFLTRICRSNSLIPADSQLMRQRTRGEIATLRKNRLVLNFGFPNLIAAKSHGDSAHE